MEKGLARSTPSKAHQVACGGDKTGDDRFYEVHVPKAEALWRRHRASIEAELEAERRKKESPK